SQFDFEIGPSSHEHNGASFGRIGAQQHETGHSFVGRGAMPRDGDANWLDEGAMTWLDFNQPRFATLEFTGKFEQLSGHSPYKRHVTGAAYGQGAMVMADLDLIFAEQGGLRPLLGEFTQRCMHKTYTTSMFENFLLEKAPDVEVRNQIREVFRLKVYGGVHP
ncbi:MAG: hypothetical protein AAFQ82_11480, partial [Myxococcota bacterium]